MRVKAEQQRDVEFTIKFGHIKPSTITKALTKVQRAADRARAHATFMLQVQSGPIVIARFQVSVDQLLRAHEFKADLRSPKQPEIPGNTVARPLKDPDVLAFGTENNGDELAPFGDESGGALLVKSENGSLQKNAAIQLNPVEKGNDDEEKKELEPAAVAEKKVIFVGEQHGVPSEESVDFWDEGLPVIVLKERKQRIQNNTKLKTQRRAFKFTPPLSSPPLKLQKHKSSSYVFACTLFLSFRDCAGFPLLRIISIGCLQPFPLVPRSLPHV